MIVTLNVPMRFPEKLQGLIDARGTNQSRLARLTGISQSAISAMTREAQRPYLDQAAILARALDVPLDYLADDSLDDPSEVGPLTAEQRHVLEMVEVIGYREALARLMGVPERARDERVLGVPAIDPSSQVKAINHKQ